MTPAFALPDGYEPRSFDLPAISAGLGIKENRLDDALRFVGWNYERAEKEIAVEGARERFAEALRVCRDVAQERRIVAQIRHVLSSGPVALAERSVETLASMPTHDLLKRVAREYDPAQHGGRLICGATGIGKSVAAVTTISRLVRSSARSEPGAEHATSDLRRREADIAWIRAFDLPNARLAHRLGDGEAELVSLATTARFCVLDDLGWEARRAGADDVIAEVIATRYDRGLVTYATTGMTLAEFTERYGSAIVRRIVEGGGGSGGRVLDCWAKTGGSK